MLMFKRKKIHSELDAYIHRRYEDQAVSIHYDMKNGRGTYSYYAPWVEAMLQSPPGDQLREKRSRIFHHPQELNRSSAAWEESPGTLTLRQAAGSQSPEAILESVEEEEEKERKEGKKAEVEEGEKKDCDKSGAEEKARHKSTTQGIVFQENADHRLSHRQKTEQPIQNQTVIRASQSRICTIL